MQGSQGARHPPLPPALAGLYPHLMPMARDTQQPQHPPSSASAAQHQASLPPKHMQTLRTAQRKGHGGKLHVGTWSLHVMRYQYHHSFTPLLPLSLAGRHRPLQVIGPVTTNSIVCHTLGSVTWPHTPSP